MEPGSGKEGLLRDKELHAGWSKLEKAETQLRNRWWSDGESDPRLLDEWLNTKIVMYQYRLQNNMLEPLNTGAREQNGERLLYHQRIARGSYHHEKAEFCLEMAQGFKTDAELNESRIRDKIATKRDLQLTKDMVTSSRRIAANCYHMAANCLTMPESEQKTLPNET